MTALAKAVSVGGVRYAAGTDHTAMPPDVVDQIRNSDAWVGGVAPALSALSVGKGRLSSGDFLSSGRLRLALGISEIPSQPAGVPAERFGFVGNNSTDNLAAWIRMVNFINTSGGNVAIVFPKGDFKVGAAAGVPQITVSNVRFRGAGLEVTTLRLTSGVYFDLYGASTIQSGFELRDMTISYATPDTATPTIRSQGWTRHSIEGVRFYNGGTSIEMGSSGKASYSLRMRNLSVVIGNVGKPFVNLVNGAGLYWDTFDNIYHMAAAAPTFDRASTMNTVAGTNVVDIVGSWDTVELSVFAEKMYRVINIVGVPSMSVFNVKLKDSVCDYIRDRVFSAEMTGSGGGASSLHTVSFDNVYAATWEGEGFYFGTSGTNSAVSSVTFSNVNTVFTGKQGLLFNSNGGSSMRRFILGGCRFVCTGRLTGTTYQAFEVNNVSSLLMSDCKMGAGGDGASWGYDSGIKISTISGGEFLISNTIAEGFDIAHSLTPTSVNARKQVRAFGNVWTGTGSTTNYAGVKTTGFGAYVKPATTVDWYNVTPFDLDIYIGGSSITAIKVDGVTLPITAGHIVLEPGHYYSITYTDGNNANVTYSARQ